MTNHANKKFEPVRVLLESLIFFWWCRSKFIKELAIPTLLLVVIWAVDKSFFHSASGLTRWGFWFLYQFGFTFFAVTCHRIVLVENSKFDIQSFLNKRIAIFAFWEIVASFIAYLISTLVLTIAANNPFLTLPFESSTIWYVVYSLSAIPALYVIGRICLVFPATAIDVRSSIKRSWNQTKGNGWKLVVVIGLYPWILSILLWLVARSNQTLGEQVIVALAYYVVLALEVIALSLTFRSMVPGNEFKNKSA